MKHILLVSLVVTSLTFATLSHADFTFHSSSSTVCENISGQWSGSGKATNAIFKECKYHGVGTVSKVDEAGHFTLDIAATKESGSFLCPREASRQLKGTCQGGVVIFMTEYGNLNGDFSEASGTAGGTLTIMPGVTAEVSAQFQRIG